MALPSPAASIPDPRTLHQSGTTRARPGPCGVAERPGLRPSFIHQRKFLGPLCSAAWQTVRELMAVAAGEEKGFRPGMVAMSQTFGDQPNLHPHVPAAGDGRALEALDFVARLLAHVPEPRGHLVHDHGACSNVVRGKLKAQSQAQRAESLASGPGALSPAPAALASPSLAALRRGWAQLPRRVSEIDPLVCPCCRGVMRIVSFITERRVIRRILDHLILDHLGASARRAVQNRAPPLAAGPVPDSL